MSGRHGFKRREGCGDGTRRHLPIMAGLRDCRSVRFAEALTNWRREIWVRCQKGYRAGGGRKMSEEVGDPSLVGDLELLMGETTAGDPIAC